MSKIEITINANDEFIFAMKRLLELLGIKQESSLVETIEEKSASQKSTQNTSKKKTVKEEVADKAVDTIESNKASEQEEKVITLEELRALLAQKSQSGMQAEVKELITKCGAKKLTDVDPAKYNHLFNEASAL